MKFKEEWIYLGTLFLSLLAPRDLNKVYFVPTRAPLEVTTNKNYPPYLAHLEVNWRPEELASPADVTEELVARHDSEREEFDVDAFAVSSQLKLEELHVSRAELVSAHSDSVLSATSVSDKNIEGSNDQNWKEGLNKWQLARLEQSGIDPQVFAAETQAEFQGSDLVDQKRHVEQSLLLVGHIELGEGLGFTDKTHLEVRRYVDGVYVEKGEVDLKEGEYRIRLSSLEGRLIARLLDVQMRILGEGHGRLTQVSPLESQPRGPSIRIRPASAFKSEISSEYGGKNPPREVYRKSLGGEDLEKASDLSPRSATAMEVTTPGFYPAVFYRPAHQWQDLKVLPENMVKSLRQIVSDQRAHDLNDPQGTLIWGRAMVDGQPLNGVSVSIDGEEDIEPIYFNEFYLPDPNLKSTSSHGVFAYLGISEGLKAIRGVRGDKQVGFNYAFVERGSAAIVELSTSIRSRQSRILVFDAFQGMPVDSAVKIDLFDEVLETKAGEINVRAPETNQFLFFETHTDGNYVPARYQAVSDQDQIYLPQIPAQWLSSIISEMRITEFPNTGQVVGFVPDQNFELLLPQEEDLASVVYFDSQGQVLNARSGVKGGGFVVFNLKQDSTEIKIAASSVFGDLDSPEIYLKTYVKNPAKIEVMSFQTGFWQTAQQNF